MTPNAQAKLAARYGAPNISALQQWNDTIDQLLEHRSVRAFTDQPLPEGTLETLVAAAQSASTSSNLQVWSVVAVQEGDRKGRLSALAGNQPYIHQAPLFLVWLADLSRVSRIADQHGWRWRLCPTWKACCSAPSTRRLRPRMRSLRWSRLGSEACTSAVPVTTSKPLPRNCNCRLRSIRSSAYALAIHRRIGQPR